MTGDRVHDPIAYAHLARSGAVCPLCGAPGMPGHPLYTGRCAAPIDVTSIGSAEPEYVCGCGACPPPPVTPKPCTCGRTGTHRPDPGIGCTTPGCLCLEPAEHQ